MRRVLTRVLIGICLFLVALGAALAYFLYAPAPNVPSLTATIQRDSIRVGELQRSFAFYVPARLAPNPPLLIALHGSMGNPRQMRRASAYRFEQLADERGFIVVYPQGYEGYWNDCRKKGSFSAKQLNIDDVRFMRALVTHFASAHGADTSRVFATGLSNGGHFAYRLALEASDLVRAVAIVAANLPTDDNSLCTPLGGAVSVMIVNGTDDPINPFAGGRVTLFGFGDRGTVRSARASAEYFARRNGITGTPIAERIPQGASTSTWAERERWSSGDCEVALYTIHGGGHVMPQPIVRAQRLLGRTHQALDAPAEIWRFLQQHGASCGPIH
jgi:polyhydroxybutyrate depolymerase